MSLEPVIVRPEKGYWVRNAEFRARTIDTPRFDFAIIEMASGR